MKNKERLGKIKEIFMNGYCRGRGDEQYFSYGQQCNCFEHSLLNLTNAQLKLLQLNKDAKSLFDICQSFPAEEAEQSMFKFLNHIGLEVEKTDDEQVKLKPNQWLIALYLFMEEGYHFARRELDGTWTSKDGWIKHYEKYQNLPQTIPIENEESHYQLKGLYIITNPFVN